MSDLGQREYATHSRKLMRIAQNLRDIGYDQYNCPICFIGDLITPFSAQTLVDIPRIVAIGGQSAGKRFLVFIPFWIPCTNNILVPLWKRSVV